MKLASCILLPFLFSALSAAAVPTSQQQDPRDLTDLISPEEIAAELDLIQASDEGILKSTKAPTFAANKQTLLSNFNVVVRVNKAKTGLTAQTAQVYVDGKHVATWDISTGRERHERAVSGKQYFSATPVGWFAPQRLVRNHWSQTWAAKMEWTVFFHGGIATHATTPSHYHELGTRASGGCVRMQYDNAKFVFTQVKTYGQGLVPSFTRYGGLKRNAQGDLIRKSGWRTIIIVENQPGK